MHDSKYEQILILFCFAFIFFLASFPENCPAETHFYIKPSISGSFRFDSNFYASEENERGVYSCLFQPGIELGLETAKSQVHLDYTLNANYLYDKGTVTAEKQASEDNYIGYTGMFMSRYLPFDRLILGIDDYFAKTRNPVKSDKFGDPVKMNIAFVNHLTPGIWYTYDPELIAGFRFRYTKIDYQRPDPEDSIECKLLTDLIYNFTDTTSFELEYHYWKRYFDYYHPNYVSNRVTGILRKQFKYSSFEIAGGYNIRKFDGSDMKDIDLPTFRIAFMYQTPSPPDPMPRWHLPRSYLLFIARQYLDDSGSENEYFIARGFSLEAGHIFLEKVLLTFGAAYQEGDYETFTGLMPAGHTELRTDKTFSLAGMIGYKITDWLSIYVKAGYKKRDSNLRGYSYTSNFCMAQLEFSYKYFSRKYSGILFEPDKRLDIYNRRL